jgi:hypothetical protein
MFSFILQATVPYPDPIPLSAPVWLIWFLLMLTYALHVIPMNLVLGGSVIAAIARFKTKGDTESIPFRMAQLITSWMPVAIAATVTFGVAPLLFVQVIYGRLLYTSSILMGWFWLLVVPILILAYYSSYYLSFRAKADESRAQKIAVFSSFLFIVIGFIYTANMSLMLLPEKFLPIYLSDGKGFSMNLTDITIYPRFLHTLVGALAVAGLCLTLYGRVIRKREPDLSPYLVQQGFLWFLGCTALNFVIGTIFLLSYPKEILMDLVNENIIGALALTLGILFGLLTLGLGVLTAAAKNKRPLLVITVVSLLLTLVSMLLLRDQVRSTLILDSYRIAEYASPQWGAIGIFAVLLLGAVATVSWMCVKLAGSKILKI